MFSWRPGGFRWLTPYYLYLYPQSDFWPNPRVVGSCSQLPSITSIWLSGFPGGSAGKESTCNAEDLGSVPGLGRSPGEGNWLPTPVFWPGEFHGWYSPWGRKELDTTDWLSFHFNINYKKMYILVTLDGTILTEKNIWNSIKIYYFPEFNFVIQNKSTILSQTSVI